VLVGHCPGARPAALLSAATARQEDAIAGAGAVLGDTLVPCFDPRTKMYWYLAKVGSSVVL